MSKLKNFMRKESFDTRFEYKTMIHIRKISYLNGLIKRTKEEKESIYPHTGSENIATTSIKYVCKVEDKIRFILSGNSYVDINIKDLSSTR